ncbi:TPA: 3-phosphoshikimate 1-carboxyvinyltransferase [Legionella pneumophila subsp. pneumophila]|uniref:3-phosphoshikimate 1-carboxyvinyltransferase n=1 Tax=Legionella pneumophila (strain Lens) TaxID=297245 RepID=AROA_LEGPL|nr:3-phosphoshikimate 1-carboxyvinyltransferase [Legionella pneumophila]Q5WWS9.1 RecName: Full=3-phosphoshikimate 1-carboxyvinyltransferase; AltName: Full=5-enolpyruvylshikimate-3-phosphate synthase; Short=EPSP synthase; Short=EPSPS [Legionella pneumophila str. Lens]RYW84616.1 3-phosphoshikimate 1-carboxyvinyltransferase [Legionella pneumophila]RYW90780.1 3-phosphoshikimate 1-carboxyvinyltransferase [Legionella pneumophila]CAH15610.1 3-phosphoshikimate 1-carboxyvinyltransferase [Legionella pneu
MLNFISKPVGCLKGEITVPGDKSISHRSIIFGAIAIGTSVIDGFLDGEDCIATLKAFQSMGVRIEGPDKQRVIIHGVGKYGLKQPQNIIDCGNSGTSMRLLAGLLAAQQFDSQLTGDESLLKRPMLRISRPLSQMGADVTTQDGKPPIVIKGGKKLNGVHYVMPEASAQVKSCLLLAGMYAEGQTKITENAVSRDHTERMLRTFSYPVQIQDGTIVIDRNGECHGTRLNIPGDISSAAFFIVAASITPDSDVLIRNVGINPTRTGIIHILTEMGADIRILNQRAYGEEPVADLHIRYSQLKGIDIPVSMVPLAIDEFPVIFIAAACAQGKTTLHGAKELRLKESDRIGAMVDGLNQLGVHAEGFDDGILIEGGSIQGGEVNSRGDHRIAMSFAIAGAVASAPVTIKNCANVATSFPSFVTTANMLHFQIEEYS